MAAVVRRAVAGDVAAMVGLSEAKRTAYEREQPIFWRKAKDSAERQRPFFETVIARDDSIALVAEGAGRIDGFLIGRVAPAPPAKSESKRKTCQRQHLGHVMDTMSFLYYPLN